MPIQIVFIDDSKSVLKTIEILLKNRVQNGEIAIRTFSKVVDFLDEIESNSLEFSILFLDINMPVLSGYDVLKKLRGMEGYKHIPIIALTTESTKDALERGKELGFNDWIVKINAPNTLLQWINMVIDKYSPKEKLEDKGERAALDTQSALHQMRQMFVTIEELNKKLLIAEENKSRFLSLIYNEFNNPLMSITILMKDVIEDKSKTKEEIVESISMVYSDILILNSQLSNILIGADIESTSGISKHLSKFNIQTMIDDIIDIQHVIHREKHIEVEVSLSLPELIYQDRDKYFLIFRNLIDNAFEFSPEASKVTIKGVVEEDNLIFSVYNMGNRIKEPNRMYDVFYHEHSDFSRMHHGLGLGLAIVKHLSNFLGGYVTYCVEEGRHLFKVSLPLDPNAPGITFEDDISTFIFDDDIENRF